MPTADTHGDSEAQTRAPDAALPGFSKLDVAGYILAFVLPLFGLVIGVILLSRPQPQKSRHGLWIIVISVLVGILFVAALILSSHGVSTGEAE